MEIAQIEVLPGHEAAFELGVAEAKPAFARARGFLGMELHRSVEYPARYRLFVRWDTVEHHMIDFRESKDFGIWRSLAGPHFASPPQVEHVTKCDLTE